MILRNPLPPQEDGTVKLTQMGLIACIITALGLDGASMNRSPAEYCALLGEDPDGMERQEVLN